MASRRAVVSLNIQEKMDEVVPGINLGKGDKDWTSVDGENPGDSPGILENQKESLRIRKIQKVTARRQDGSTYQMTPRKKVYGEPLPLRLSPEDRYALEKMASDQGSTAAALVRRAVKEMIRRGGK